MRGDRVSGAQKRIRQARVPATAIGRPRLARHLESAMKYPLTVVTAPAGFGKTWLVSDWLDSHPELASGWVTVDEYDVDPTRFWRTVIAAVGDSFPEAAKAVVELMDSPAAGVPLVVDRLVDGLAEAGEEFILVVDDVHLLGGEGVLESFRQFLSLLPSTGHVLLVGRHDAPIPLARWRLAGELLEVRTADLRLSPEESRAVVTESMGLDLAPAIIEEIQRKTMGWMAGVRLAATTTAASPRARERAGQLPEVGAVEGAYEAIGDYLVEEALDGLNPSERQFLLDTSILERLSGPLGDAVSERSDSGRLLEQLADSAMFTDRTANGWFRYHDLFRDALRVILHRRQPAREVALHRRAAHWLRDNGSSVRAIRHAMAAGDADLASEWLVESGPALFEAKLLDTMCSLFADLEQAAETLSPPALATWCFPVLYCNTGAPDADRVHEDARDRISTLSEAEERRFADTWMNLPEPYASSKEFVRGIDATLAHRRGDIDLAAHNMRAQRDSPSASGWVEASAGEMLIYAERYTEGVDLMSSWADYAFSTTNLAPGNQAYTLTCFALAKHGEGNLAEAETLADHAINLMRDHGLSSEPQAAIATVPLAWVAWERGDLDAAFKIITSTLDRIAGYGEVPAHAYAYTVLARIHHSRGNSDEMHQALQQARLLPSGRPVTGHFADRIALEHARSALLLGDITHAKLALSDWQERLERGANTMSEHLLLTRLALLNGDDPRPLLDTQPDGIVLTAAHHIELHKIRALIALQEENEAAALDRLIDAMEIAAHTGHRQTFLDDIPTFGALLDNAAAMAGHQLHRYTQTETPTSTPDTPPPALIEPLTQRELDVLRLLPTHLTYKEMAAQLYVSTNTIKSYLKHIYRKLEADNRSEAVNTAETLGLIF